MDEFDWFVQRRVKSMFKGADHDRATSLLRRYKGDTPQGRKRVHLAILKLCKGDIGQLAELVESALVDYRDVLYWAEYVHKDK